MVVLQLNFFVFQSIRSGNIVEKNREIKGNLKNENIGAGPEESKITN